MHINMCGAMYATLLEQVMLNSILSIGHGWECMIPESTDHMQYHMCE